MLPKDSAQPQPFPATLPWSAISSLSFPDEGSSVFFIHFKTETGASVGEVKESKVVTIVGKGSSTTPQELYAYLVARSINMKVPKTWFVQWPSPTYQYIQEGIARCADQDELTKRRVGRILNRSYFLLQEYIPQAHTLDRHIGKTYKAITYSQAWDLGSFVALDVVLNNYDRIPCGTVWANIGNYNNIIVSHDAFIAIDNGVTARMPVEEHTEAVAMVLRDIDGHAKNIHERMTTNPGFTFESDWVPIASGMKESFQALATLAHADGLVGIKTSLMKLLKHDWENVWADACTGIKDEFLEGVTNVLKEALPPTGTTNPWGWQLVLEETEFALQQSQMISPKPMAPAAQPKKVLSGAIPPPPGAGPKKSSKAPPGPPPPPPTPGGKVAPPAPPPPPPGPKKSNRDLTNSFEDEFLNSSLAGTSSFIPPPPLGGPPPPPVCISSSNASFVPPPLKGPPSATLSATKSFEKAEILREHGNTTAAIQHYQEALRGGLFEACAPLAYLLALEGHPKKAKNVYMECPESDLLRCPEACNNLGVLLMGEGYHEDAITYFQKAIELGDTNAAANLASVFVRLGKFSLAAAVCPPAAMNTFHVAQHGLSPTTHGNEMMRIFKEAADSGDPAATRNLGVMHALAGDRAIAEDLLLDARARGSEGTRLPLAYLRHHLPCLDVVVCQRSRCDANALREAASHTQSRPALIVFPEGSCTEQDLPALEMMSSCLNVIVVCGSCGEDGGYITSIVCENGKRIGQYRKRAKACSRPGDKAGVFTTTFGLRIGVLICMDIEDPQLVQDTLDLKPHIIVNPSHIPYVKESTALHSMVGYCVRYESIAVKNNVWIVRSDLPTPLGTGSSQILTPNMTLRSSGEPSDCTFVTTFHFSPLESAPFKGNPVTQLRSTERDNVGNRYVVDILSLPTACKLSPCFDVCFSGEGKTLQCVVAPSGARFVLDTQTRGKWLSVSQGGEIEVVVVPEVPMRLHTFPSGAFCCVSDTKNVTLIKAETLTKQHLPHIPAHPRLVCMSGIYGVYAYGSCLYRFDETSTNQCGTLLYQHSNMTARVTALHACHQGDYILCAFDSGEVVRLCSDTKQQHAYHIYLTPYTFTALGDLGDCWIGITSQGTELVTIDKKMKVFNCIGELTNGSHLETFGLTTFAFVDNGILFLASLVAVEEKNGKEKDTKWEVSLHEVVTFSSNPRMRIAHLTSNERLRRSEHVCPASLLAVTQCGHLLLIEFTQNRLFKPLTKIF